MALTIDEAGWGFRDPQGNTGATASSFASITVSAIDFVDDNGTPDDLTDDTLTPAGTLKFIYADSTTPEVTMGLNTPFTLPRDAQGNRRHIVFDPTDDAGKASLRQ